MDLQRDIETVLVSGRLNFRGDFFAGVPAIVCTGADGHRQVVLPLEIKALSVEEAVQRQKALCLAIAAVKEAIGKMPILITEDRWLRNRDTMALRLLAHLGRFTGIFARNCGIEKINRTDAAAFLEDCHSYGDAKSRYHYGLFHQGELVGVAEFSNARKWRKAGADADGQPAELLIRSYEWVRYASLPGTRIVGGMGKVLKHFIAERQPDDIMSYADLEWSEGQVYRTLGFEEEGLRRPVLFRIGEDGLREPLPEGEMPGKTVEMPLESTSETPCRYFMNFGSIKYRLKLTEYRS